MKKPIDFYTEPSLIDRRAYIKRLQSAGLLPKIEMPKKIIILYVPSALFSLKKSFELKKYPFFLSDLDLIEGTRIGILSRIGMGGPSLALYLEKLIALGCEEFFSVGMFGSLSKELNVGDAFQVSAALRDEGVSQHYLPPSDLVKCRPRAKDFSLPTVTSWTTDAFYRETKSQLQNARASGAKVVDMECASFYAIAEFYKKTAVALGAVSDILTENDWAPQFHQVGPQIESLLKLTVDSFRDEI